MNNAREKILIVGYGNPMRGDDGAGRAVLERLESNPVFKKGCRLDSCHQLLPEHSEMVAGRSLVIFVDASRADAPGEVLFQELSGCAEDGEGSFNPHAAGPEDVLAAARRLYGARPSAWLCRVGGCCFGFSESLSPEAERAVDEAVSKIVEITQQFKNARSTGEQKR